MTFFPYDHLYKPRFINPSKKPRTPILVSRNSTSVTFKLPPYKPLLSENTIRDDPNKSVIISNALFGKERYNRTDVAESCN